MHAFRHITSRFVACIVGLMLLAGCQASGGSGNSCARAEPGSELYNACRASAEAMIENRWGP